MFRLFSTHWKWTVRYLVQPGWLGEIDSYAFKLIHPVREGCSEKQIGMKGLSNRRWIVAGNLSWLLNHLGLVIGWDFTTAIVHDTYFPPMVAHFVQQTILFFDMGFHTQEGDPENLKVCQPFTHHERMLVETALLLP